MARNSEDTRKRLLEAAAAEFAAHGIAGARVDRIAATANCNKQAIYAYFGSKEALADAVLDTMCEEMVASTPIDPYDLPGYAVRLFDRYQSNPELLRLATWYQLEGKSMPPVALASMAKKIEAVQQAQAAGAVSTRFSADMVLLLILSLTRLGAPDSVEVRIGLIAPDAFRQSIVAAVRRLIEP